MTWIEGSVFDRLMDGETQMGTVMEQENRNWFWHRYNPHGVGYEKSKEAARAQVEVVTVREALRCRAEHEREYSTPLKCELPLDHEGSHRADGVRWEQEPKA